MEIPGIPTLRTWLDLVSEGFSNLKDWKFQPGGGDGWTWSWRAFPASKIGNSSFKDLGFCEGGSDRDSGVWHQVPPLTCHRLPQTLGHSEPSELPEFLLPAWNLPSCSVAQRNPLKSGAKRGWGGSSPAHLCPICCSWQPVPRFPAGIHPTRPSEFLHASFCAGSPGVDSLQCKSHISSR